MKDAAGLNPQPQGQLMRLEKLVGTWSITGRTLESEADNIRGRAVIDWLPGGFYMEQRSEIEMAGMKAEALEIIGYDPETDTFPSTVYGNMAGNPMTYRWDVRGSHVTHSGYGATYSGQFSEDGQRLIGGWRPDEGQETESNVAYDVVMTKMS